MTKLSKRKSRLQFKIGGFAEIDFIDDNTAHLVMEASPEPASQTFLVH